MIFDRFSNALEWKPDQLYRVPTRDGATIALGRWLPRGTPSGQRPVVLAHGLGANRFDLDFDEKLSLARFLARLGTETWVLELRGRGLTGGAIDTTFDDQAQFDVEAALQTVISTGVKDVAWVGHSKGALVAWAHLVRNPQAPIAALVALGSPVRFEGQEGLKKFVRGSAPLLSLKSIPIQWPAKLGAPLGLPPGPFSRYMVNADNMDPDVIRKAIANVTSDVLGGVARQFARWVERDVFDGNDGVDYRAGMAGIRIPTLLVSGSVDLLAPQRNVDAAKAMLGGPVETLMLHGYGHGDLSLGRNVAVDLYPRIADFLARAP